MIIELLFDINMHQTTTETMIIERHYLILICIKIC